MNFSGLARLAAGQGVGVKTVCANLNSLSVYLTTDRCLEPGSTYRISSSFKFSHLRRRSPRVLARPVRMNARIAAERSAEIIQNVQIHLRP